jgi:hypothetical protein
MPSALREILQSDPWPPTSPRPRIVVAKRFPIAIMGFALCEACSLKIEDLVLGFGTGFWNAQAVRLDLNSTHFGTCEFRNRLDDHDLRHRQVTKPRSFVTKVGTPAIVTKVELCVLRELQTKQSWQTSQSSWDCRTVDCGTVGLWDNGRHRGIS